MKVERTLLWPEGNNNTILLTLDVIDDDEEYSSITVESRKYFVQLIG